MLTFVTVPKAFDEHFALIQHNAIRSWTALRPAPQILLAGDAPGVAEAAAKLHVCHLGPVKSNEMGTPLLDDVLKAARHKAQHHLLCYINADVVLTDSFTATLMLLRRELERFVMVGQCRDLKVDHELATHDPHTMRQLRQRAIHEGRLRGPAAMDYFAFPRQMYMKVPSMAVGRVYFDNWMVWSALQQGAAVVDATHAVTAIHQSHDYAHFPGGRTASRTGTEAKQNLRLAGGPRHCYTMLDATHSVADNQIRLRMNRYFQFHRFAIRLKDQADYAFWSAVEYTRPWRHAHRSRPAA